MTTKKVVTLSSVKQLIDLNGASTNVDITFTAKSLDNSDFYALVVDQKTLDSNVPLEFKLAKGSISANIISDNNVYQNHFLCLKSDKPCQVELVIDKKEIQSAIPPPKPKPVGIYQPMEHFAPKQTNQPHQHHQPHQPHQNKKNKSTNLVLIFVVCALAIVGSIAYYHFVYSKKKEKMTISKVLPVEQIPIATTPLEIETSNSFATRLSKLLE